MTRIYVGNSGKWFDIDSAKKFKEDTYFDGHNHCSVNTRDQWTHETLYLTKGGRYVLEHVSAWQGSCDRYEFISQDEAYHWLAFNGHDDQVPADVLAESEV